MERILKSIWKSINNFKTYNKDNPEDLGIMGEFLIENELYKTNTIYGKVVHNIYLQKEDGTTTEIDIIYITQHGIYVIESKNYNGWIFGNYKYKNWTVTYKTGLKKQLYNPIWQNNTHIKYLKKYLPNANEKAFFSIVVFSDTMKIKNLVNDFNITKTNVINMNCLNDLITRNAMNNKPIYSPADVDQISTYLYTNFGNINDNIKKSHIDNIKNQYGN